MVRASRPRFEGYDLPGLATSTTPSSSQPTGLGEASSGTGYGAAPDPTQEAALSIWGGATGAPLAVLASAASAKAQPAIARLALARWPRVVPLQGADFSTLWGRAARRAGRDQEAPR